MLKMCLTKRKKEDSQIFSSTIDRSWLKIYNNILGIGKSLWNELVHCITHLIRRRHYWKCVIQILRGTNPMRLWAKYKNKSEISSWISQASSQACSQPCARKKKWEMICRCQHANIIINIKVICIQFSEIYLTIGSLTHDFNFYRLPYRMRLETTNVDDRRKLISGAIIARSHMTDICHMLDSQC